MNFLPIYYPINWDAGQFALGIYHYDLTLHQPHPPGYFLFVMLGRLINFLVGNPNIALVVITALAGILTGFLFYRLVKEATASKQTALLASMLLITNQAFLYYLITGLTYIFEALTATALGYILHRQQKNNSVSLALIFSATLGILTGFRPSVIIISLPFLVAGLWIYRRQPKTIALAVGVFMIVCSTWLIPFILLNGGWSGYWQMVVSQFGAAKESKIYNLPEHAFLLKSVLWIFGPLFMISFAKLRAVKNGLAKNISWVYIAALLWMPVVYFFTHFGDTGYLLGLVPVIIIINLPAITELSFSKLGRLFILLIVSLQLIVFFSDVDWLNHHKLSKMNYPTMTLHDQRLANYENIIRQYRPEEVAIVMLRGQYINATGGITSYSFDDARPLAPYVPEYGIYDFLGTPGNFFYIKEYEALPITSNNIELPSTVAHLLILADYISPTQHPAFISLDPNTENQSLFNFYSADISRIRQFEFLGFNFYRK